MYSQAVEPEYDENEPKDTSNDSSNQRINHWLANSIPDAVKDFLLFLNESIENNDVSNIQDLYENTFPKLSEVYYEKSEWPDSKVVSAFLTDESVKINELFMILYTELYYRHIYAHIQGGPLFGQRIESFLNYCSFFVYVIEKRREVKIPDIWLWELIDEFCYQFQNYSQYRSRSNDKQEEELEKLVGNEFRAWNIIFVLNVFHELANKSNIKEQLEATAKGENPDVVAGDLGCFRFYKMLGYFSLIGLLRLHCSLSDYNLAIKIIDPIDVTSKIQFTRIPACQISTSYYVGFAYMMMRRYSDAIRTFTSILLYVQRTKQLYDSRSYQNDQVKKQTEQMYHLLAICQVLHPQNIDEAIQQVLRERSYNDSIVKMQMGDLDVFQSFFSFACPKFVIPHPPTVNESTNDFVWERFEHQRQVFIDEVKQQLELPRIRSYLKLYKTLPLTKLALLMELETKKSLEKKGEQANQEADDDDSRDKALAQLLTQLLCLKHKMKDSVCTKGISGLDGKFQSVSELDFYIDNGMIYIADTKVSYRYGEFFICKSLSFADLSRRLQKL